MRVTPTEWGSFLRERLGVDVSVKYGRSRTQPVQAERPPGRGWRLRLHELFADAPPEIREALARWLRVGRRARKACDALDAWLDKALAALPPPCPRRIVLKTAGRIHDLGVLSNALLASELKTECAAGGRRPAITWGRSNGRARSSLTLGSYAPAQDVVRVHPVLDQPHVPDWFVRYILFHELLHALLPKEHDAAGHALHHGPLYRRRERAYLDFKRSRAWQSRHLGRLIREARALS